MRARKPIPIPTGMGYHSILVLERAARRRWPKPGRFEFLLPEPELPPEPPLALPGCPVVWSLLDLGLSGNHGLRCRKEVPFDNGVLEDVDSRLPRFLIDVLTALAVPDANALRDERWRRGWDMGMGGGGTGIVWTEGEVKVGILKGGMGRRRREALRSRRRRRLAVGGA